MTQYRLQSLKGEKGVNMCQNTPSTHLNPLGPLSDDEYRERRGKERKGKERKGKERKGKETWWYGELSPLMQSQSL